MIKKEKARKECSVLSGGRWDWIKIQYMNDMDGSVDGISIYLIVDMSIYTNPDGNWKM